MRNPQIKAGFHRLGPRLNREALEQVGKRGRLDLRARNERARLLHAHYGVELRVEAFCAGGEAVQQVVAIDGRRIVAQQREIEAHCVQRLAQVMGGGAEEAAALSAQFLDLLRIGVLLFEKQAYLDLVVDRRAIAARRLPADRQQHRQRGKQAQADGAIEAGAGFEPERRRQDGAELHGDEGGRVEGAGPDRAGAEGQDHPGGHDGRDGIALDRQSDLSRAPGQPRNAGERRLGERPGAQLRIIRLAACVQAIDRDDRRFAHADRQPPEEGAQRRRSKQHGHGERNDARAEDGEKLQRPHAAGT